MHSSFFFMEAALACKLSDITTSRVYLTMSEKSTSPFCYVASNAVDVMGHSQANFLATQVWPSARTASVALVEHFDPSWSVCEFGCGPGLPSLTAAKLGACKVIGTDLDEVALALVEKAASRQALSDVISTAKFDLTRASEEIPEADLYLFSDVFQSGPVATGAARVCQQILENSSSARIWIFAQSDRAQREIFLDEMVNISGEEMNWKPSSSVPDRLWLVNVDELEVQYC